MENGRSPTDTEIPPRARPRTEPRGTAAWMRLAPPELLLGRRFCRSRRDLVHDRRIRERCRIAERPVLRDVAQKPSHDLSRARLRELRREDDVCGLRDRADL